MPALTQQRTSGEVSPLRAPKTVKLSPSAVRIINSKDIPEAFGTANKAVLLDTLNYNSDEAFDTLFYVALTTINGSFYDGTLEFDERFTPGQGTGGFFGPNGTAWPAAPGQDKTFGFCLGGPDPVQGDADDQLAFFVQKVEQGDGFIVSPPFPAAVAALDLGLLMDPNPASEGGCFELDLTGLNVFFEADEEIFKGFFLIDNGTAGNAEVQFLLDDGDASGTDPNYNPPRSIVFAEPPFVPSFGAYIWGDNANYLWYETVDYQAQPVLNGELTVACGFFDDCNFNQGDTFTYTGCVKNNSGAPKRVMATVQAFLPNDLRPMPALLALLADLGPLLHTARFGRAVRGYRTAGSTNTEAVRWAEAGAPEGALVVAEHQTAGRGRLGRAWTDTSGQGLLLSVVLRPSLPADRLGLVTLAGGVAVAEAVEAWTAPVAPRIKWPNDVLLGGRKCCGMLLESSLGGDPFVVLGIGLNVNQDAFPTPLADRATSLRLETGRLVPRAALLARLLERLEHWSNRLAAGAFTDVRDAFAERMTGRGAPASVCLTESGQHLEGIVEGIDPAGALCLRTNGTLRTLHAGDVTFQQMAEDG